MPILEYLILHIILDIERIENLKNLWYKIKRSNAYRCASPALRTAELTALTAVWMLVSSWVRSPVADGTFFCSANTYRVSVMQFESNAGGSYCCCCAIAIGISVFKHGLYWTVWMRSAESISTCEITITYDRVRRSYYIKARKFYNIKQLRKRG